MKHNHGDALLEQLMRISRNLEVLTHSEMRADLVRTVDQLVASLNVLRSRLTEVECDPVVSKAQESIVKLIEFLQIAKNDKTLSVLVAQALGKGSSKAKRAPIEIPPNLSNGQIRELLDRDLSRSELKMLAAQRGISIGKNSVEEVRRELLRAIDRQDGYERLASPGN